MKKCIIFETEQNYSNLINLSGEVLLNNSHIVSCVDFELTQSFKARTISKIHISNSVV